MTGVVSVFDFNERGDTTLYAVSVDDVSLLFDGVDHD